MNARAPEGFAALIAQLRDFMDSEVIPREDLQAALDSEAVDRIVAPLQALAAARGRGSPRARVEDGGMGLSWTECCAYLEQAGRSFLGPAVLRCAPPTQPDVYQLIYS